MVHILYNILSILSFFFKDHKKSIISKKDDKKVTAIITPQITPYRRQNGVTLPWLIPEMALLQKSLWNGLVSSIALSAANKSTINTCAKLLSQRHLKLNHMMHTTSCPSEMRFELWCLYALRLSWLKLYITGPYRRPFFIV